MKNYVTKGDVLEVSAPAGGIASGQLAKVGKIIGVASGSGFEGDIVAVQIKGVYEVSKEPGMALTQGEELYYVAATGVLNKTATGNTFAGYAYTDAAATDATVKVLLSH